MALFVNLEFKGFVAPASVHPADDLLDVFLPSDRKIVEDPKMVSAVMEQEFDEVRTDESATSCDEDSLCRQLIHDFLGFLPALCSWYSSVDRSPGSHGFQQEKELESVFPGDGSPFANRAKIDWHLTDSGSQLMCFKDERSTGTWGLQS